MSQAASTMRNKEDEDLSRKQAILAGIPYIVTKQFPWKLHEMLEQAEKDGKEHIVSWLPGGTSFKVHQPEGFVNELMKNHFLQTKYKSFQRQLNLWGFKRNTHEALGKGSYSHPLFLRGRKDLCQEMGRQKSSKVDAISLGKAAAEAANADAGIQHLRGPFNSSGIVSNSSASSIESMQGSSSAQDISPSSFLQNMLAAVSTQQQRMQQQRQQQLLLKQREEEQKRLLVQTLLGTLNNSSKEASLVSLLSAVQAGTTPAGQASQLSASQSNPSLIETLRSQGNGATNEMLKKNTSSYGALDAIKQLFDSKRSETSTKQQFQSTALLPANHLAHTDVNIFQAMQQRAAVENILRGGFTSTAMRSEGSTSQSQTELLASLLARR